MEVVAVGCQGRRHLVVRAVGGAWGSIVGGGGAVQGGGGGGGGQWCPTHICHEHATHFPPTVTALVPRPPPESTRSHVHFHQPSSFPIPMLPFINIRIPLQSVSNHQLTTLISSARRRFQWKTFLTLLDFV
ncbi:hypothetical protein L1987_22321 [Smallanthus sonchifolius]|uniref:Uncharacterized protein n=1 Tax=Smallanthus sonchifolius TaxID=185202 RepID=A0ACB9IFZ8_9ASTR|nr:hypothetical protein L1987_22321 [Smallanthus sonchifolius]